MQINGQISFNTRKSLMQFIKDLEVFGIESGFTIEHNGQDHYVLTFGKGY